MPVHCNLEPNLKSRGLACAVTLVLGLYAINVLGCGGGASGAAVNVTQVESQGSVSVRAGFWADNWFQFFLGEQLMMEDSVSITTERSFNAETALFKADFPLQLNVVLKDYRENDTGLEYIGSGRQQMGDGGFIAQFVDADSGSLIAVTDSEWRCLVLHEAPLDKRCEKESNPIAGEAPCGFRRADEPAGWKDPAFDDSAWEPATVHSRSAVRPKGGFDRIEWDSSAELIWTGDLETHNTVLCRRTIVAE